MMVQITAASLVAESRALAMPACIGIHPHRRESGRLSFPWEWLPP
jgi:histidine ammonia-lyase